MMWTNFPTKGNITPEKRRGFTLVEVAVVLTIIALIAAAIVGGMELVASAGMRKQISQVDSIISAVNTFRGKYNCLPGDCPNGSAFNLTAQRYNGCASTLTNSGNGNGTIGDNPFNLNTIANAPGWEMQIFWNSLIETRLVDGDYLRSCERQNAKNLSYGIRGTFGASPLVGVGFAQSVHQLFLGSTIGGGFYTPSAVVGNSLSAIEAYQFDHKMDDGVPSTGKVIARRASNVQILGVTPAGNEGTAAPDRCVEPGNLRYANPSTNAGLSCVLAIRMGF